MRAERSNVTALQRRHRRLSQRARHGVNSQSGKLQLHSTPNGWRPQTHKQVDACRTQRQLTVDASIRARTRGQTSRAPRHRRRRLMAPHAAAASLWLRARARFDQFCDYTSIVGFRLLKSSFPLWVR